MAKMNKPEKSRIRKAKTSISNVQRNTESSVEEKKRRIDEIIKAQEFVDDWNNNYVGKKDMEGNDLTEHFSNLQLESGLIIQMFMENPLKKLVKTESGDVSSINFGLRQIDGRKRNTDAAKWVTTPFPVIDKGVIMAISPQVKVWFYETKEKLEKYNPEEAKKFIIPEVGDIVYTGHFMFKDNRYYIDKQAKCEDFVKNQEELRLVKFDFLFKITNYEIESIVKKENYNKLADNYGSKTIVLETAKETV